MNRTPHVEASSSVRVSRLFDDHQGRLYRLALRLSHDAEEAKDLVQETFLRVARKPAAVPRGRSSEEAWLVRILINLCRDRRRRGRVRDRALSRIEAERSGSVDPESAQVARVTVRRALRRLSPRRRAVVVLHELEGIPVREIARTLGTAQVTVRWHLSRARKDLATWLAPLSRDAAAGGWER